jgi:sulfofructose kinase
MTKVMVLGMAAVDFVMAVDALPTEPAKYSARNAEIIGGGPAANAAVAVARLGGEPVVVARLGGDSLGDLIVSDLASEGVGTDFVDRAPGGRSSFSSVLVDVAGERQIMNFRGSGLTEATGWIASAPRPAAVLVDTRWPQGAETALDLARDWGVPGVLDGEAPITPELLEKASHLALSRQGLQSLVNGDDLAHSLGSLARRVSGWVCVTDGEHGVWYTGAHGIDHIPAFRVNVVDTLGAGDVWHGAFALSLAEGMDEVEAIHFANATAALKCMTFGGRAGSPCRAAVLDFLKENE